MNEFIEFFESKGYENDLPVCKVFPKFISATKCVDAKEASYARMESIPRGINAGFG